MAAVSVGDRLRRRGPDASRRPRSPTTFRGAAHPATWLPRRLRGLGEPLAAGVPGLVATMATLALVFGLGTASALAVVSDPGKTELEQQLQAAQARIDAVSHLKPQKTIKEVTAPATGDRIIAVGDSVMLAASPQLAERFPGISIDADVSRSMYVAADIVQAIVDAGAMRDVLVLGLGTNGPIEESSLDAVRTIAGPDVQIVLVNVQAPRDWTDGVNAELASYAQRYRNVELANWQAAIAPQLGELAPDEIHRRTADRRHLPRRPRGCPVTPRRTPASCISGRLRRPFTARFRTPCRKIVWFAFGEAEWTVEAERTAWVLGVDVEHRLLVALALRGLEVRRQQGGRDPAAAPRPAGADQVDVRRREALSGEVVRAHRGEHVAGNSSSTPSSLVPTARNDRSLRATSASRCIRPPSSLDGRRLVRSRKASSDAARVASDHSGACTARAAGPRRAGEPRSARRGRGGPRRKFRAIE